MDLETVLEEMAVMGESDLKKIDGFVDCLILRRDVVRNVPEKREPLIYAKKRTM
jgi:hypothetical protein